MKIAIVSSIFIPNLGYLEEGLAKVLTGMGHSVNVFASFHYPVNYKSEKTILSPEQTTYLQKSGKFYHISRLKTLIKFGSNIICKALKKRIKVLNPDLIILVGISDFFQVSLLNKRFNETYKIFAFIGHNYNMLTWQKSNPLKKKVKSYLINNLIKKFLYRKSIRNLNRIIFYTPDAEEIISRFLTREMNDKLQLKKSQILLGFNSDDFYFSPGARHLIRSELKFDKDEILIITVTRIDPSKRIHEIINELFILKNLDLKYVLIGFVENEYKIKIEQLIELNDLQNKIICLPFLPNELLVNYFSAADFGIWLQSSAAIQQAMGTGLPVILLNNSTTSMLIESGLNGYYIKNSLYETVNHLVSSYSYSLNNRKEIEHYNRNRLSYQAVIKNLL